MTTGGNFSRILRHSLVPRRAFLGMAASSLWGATSYAQVEDTTSQPPSSQAITLKGGTLVSFLTPEPSSLVPGQDHTPGAGIVCGKIFQGLLRFSYMLTPMPELAKTWEISADDRDCIFTLRPNVRFHDGQDLTEEDVIFSILEYHRRTSPHAGFALIDEVTALGNNQIRIRCNLGIKALLPLFDTSICPILPRRLYGAKQISPTSPVGTGAFRLEHWNKDGEIHLTRHESYWRKDVPLLDKIIYRPTSHTDANAEMALIRQGHVQLAQMYDLPPHTVASISNDASLVTSETGWAFMQPLWALDINHNALPLNDVRVRQAIQLAVDRRDLVHRVWAGQARVATGPLPSSYSRLKPKETPRDLRWAASLLNQAGMSVDDQGLRLQCDLLVQDWSPVWLDTAHSIASALRQIGIALRVVSVSPQEWAHRITTGAYRLALSCHYQGGSAPLSMIDRFLAFNHRPLVGANVSNLQDSQLDDLLHASLSEADTDIAAAEQYLIDHQALIWLVEPLFPTVSDQHLRNATSAGTGVFAGFDYVFLTGA